MKIIMNMFKFQVEPPMLTEFPNFHLEVHVVGVFNANVLLFLQEVFFYIL